MALSPGSTLGRYRIISHLGSGGMGEVYRAEDTVLSREVAIKLLPEHLAANPESLKRFQKEAKALAALSHFNILDIHDFVSNHGTCFVVTELLEGETLRQRMAKSQLSFQKAVEIAIGIAEGLAAAHSKGVIHRDLKPENIFITSQGTVKILDFGLARLNPLIPEKDYSQFPTFSQVTESGIAMGTVPYMSPEQVRGEHVDARSDVFSFGCVLYEMLARKRPFAGKTPGEIAAAILRDDPARVSDIPPELDRILQHCLKKDPESRLQSAHDLALQLKEISTSKKTTKVVQRSSNDFYHQHKVVVFLVIAMMIGAIAMFIVKHQRFSGSAHSEKIQSLAVLPLKNLSGDPKQEYFADGMTEELISKLARISALRVISRTSVMEYKGVHKKSLPQIAKELNVDGILEGSVLQSGNRVRITTQLIHAPTDKHLWADSYERDLTDILTLQNEVASAVANEIRIKLTPQEKEQFIAASQVNPAAYEAYLRGSQYASRPAPSAQELQLRISLFERATELDPNFALAYAALSMAHSHMYFKPYDASTERLAKAKAAFDKAFELSPNLVETHVALGYYYYWGFMNLEKAEREFSIAQKIMPNNTSLLNGLGAIRKRQGDFQGAMQLSKKVLELDPRNAIAAIELGIIYYITRQYAEADRNFDLAISLQPDSAGGYDYKMHNYLKWKGDVNTARQIVMKVPGVEDRNELLVLVEMLSRNYPAALKLLSLLPQKDYSSAINAAKCYQLINEASKARESYDAARMELEALIQNNGDKAELHSRIAIAYAGLNRQKDAIREGELAIQMLPVSKDAITGPAMIRNMAIVNAMIGRHEDAIVQIEYLLSNRSIATVLTVPLLRIDPTWDPLRNHPRFQKILEQHNQL